jgi:hypothetical protein
MGFTNEELAALDQASVDEKAEILKLISEEKRVSMRDRDMARVRDLDAMSDVVVRRAHAQANPSERVSVTVQSSNPERHLLGRA